MHSTSGKDGFQLKKPSNQPQLKDYSSIVQLQDEQSFSLFSLQGKKTLLIALAQQPLPEDLKRIVFQNRSHFDHITEISTTGSLSSKINQTLNVFPTFIVFGNELQKAILEAPKDPAQLMAFLAA